MIITQAMLDSIHSEDDIRTVVDAAIVPVQARSPQVASDHLEELHRIIWTDKLSELELDERR